MNSPRFNLRLIGVLALLVAGGLFPVAQAAGSAPRDNQPGSDDRRADRVADQSQDRTGAAPSRERAPDRASDRMDRGPRPDAARPSVERPRNVEPPRHAPMPDSRDPRNSSGRPHDFGRPDRDDRHDGAGLNDHDRRDGSPIGRDYPHGRSIDRETSHRDNGHRDSGPILRHDSHGRTYYTPHGYTSIRVGRDDFFYHGGIFYRSGPFGYVVVRAPRYAVVRELPFLATLLMINNLEYYRHGDIYYQACPDGYMVIDPPLSAPISRANFDDFEAQGYVSMMQGNEHFWFKDGQFFVESPEGLIWTPAPMGAASAMVPPGAQTVWHENNEYFLCDEVVFRRTPNGYAVVPAPWATEEE